MQRIAKATLVLCFTGSALWAQDKVPVESPGPVPVPAAPAEPQADQGRWILEGDLRVRAESWDWFQPPASARLQDNYAFEHARLRARFGWKEARKVEAMLEVQDVQALGLPTHSIGPGGIGQMGPGAITFAHAGASDLNTAAIRQAYLKIGNPADFQVQFGRFDYSSGMEVVPTDPTLATLKRTRIRERLIGPFDFSPYGRSFDGLRFDVDGSDLHLTGFAARPTQGGFEPRFGVDLDNVFVSDASLTFKQGELLPEGEGQLFWVHYDDNRAVPQLDNRPIALRGSIQGTGGNHLDTFGFHFLHKLGDNGDFLVWYAHQTGRWGALSHSADAFTAEAGYRWAELDWKPWVRAGYSYYSGDSDPLDGTHGTFQPILPTIRIYAQTPFYTESNLKDLFLQFQCRPTDETTIRLDGHLMFLAQPADAWYTGSGATRQTGVNGNAGRPGGGASDLATLVDLGIDQQVTETQKLSLYIGRMFGGNVVRASYPKGPNGTFFFLEYNWKFP